ncbi:hypothetical protein [Pedobacter sp. N23S346]|uniref:hypothetical protein n=1 Tax=Pedobacter sp. N23S346 TaxID=3402750 RepID=UPI003ABFE60A
MAHQPNKAVFFAALACLGWPPKGFLLFLDEKKQKSRLGSDVGLARGNLNGGSARARFDYNKDLF